MTKLTITTVRGAKIDLSTDGYGIDAAIEIKGVTHTFSLVEIKHSSNLGNYLKCGPVTAPISSETLKQIEATLVAEIEAKAATRKADEAARKAEFLASPEGKNWLLNKKMDRANSDL